uniref:Uncharacterized protein n=1 Tax=Anopheles atroparvus TaxID=41427 RepID=A0A182JCF9_ANOAO
MSNVTLVSKGGQQQQQHQQIFQPVQSVSQAQSSSGTSATTMTTTTFNYIDAGGKNFNVLTSTGGKLNASKLISVPLSKVKNLNNHHHHPQTLHHHQHVLSAAVGQQQAVGAPPTSMSIVGGLGTPATAMVQKLTVPRNIQLVTRIPTSGSGPAVTTSIANGGRILQHQQQQQHQTVNYNTPLTGQIQDTGGGGGGLQTSTQTVELKNVVSTNVKPIPVTSKSKVSQNAWLKMFEQQHQQQQPPRLSNVTLKPLAVLKQHQQQQHQSQGSVNVSLKAVRTNSSGAKGGGGGSITLSTGTAINVPSAVPTTTTTSTATTTTTTFYMKSGSIVASANGGGGGSLEQQLQGGGIATTSIFTTSTAQTVYPMMVRAAVSTAQHTSISGEGGNNSISTTTGLSTSAHGGSVKLATTGSAVDRVASAAPPKVNVMKPTKNQLIQIHQQQVQPRTQSPSGVLQLSTHNLVSNAGAAGTQGHKGLSSLYTAATTVGGYEYQLHASQGTGKGGPTATGSYSNVLSNSGGATPGSPIKVASNNKPQATIGGGRVRNNSVSQYQHPTSSSSPVVGTQNFALIGEQQPHHAPVSSEHQTLANHAASSPYRFAFSSSSASRVVQQQQQQQLPPPVTPTSTVDGAGDMGYLNGQTDEQATARILQSFVSVSDGPTTMFADNIPLKECSAATMLSSAYYYSSREDEEGNSVEVRPGPVDPSTGRYQMLQAIMQDHTYCVPITSTPVPPQAASSGSSSSSATVEQQQNHLNQHQHHYQLPPGMMMPAVQQTMPLSTSSSSSSQGASAHSSGPASNSGATTLALPPPPSPAPPSASAASVVVGATANQPTMAALAASTGGTAGPTTMPVPVAQLNLAKLTSAAGVVSGDLLGGVATNAAGRTIEYFYPAKGGLSSARPTASHHDHDDDDAHSVVSTGSRAGQDGEMNEDTDTAEDAWQHVDCMGIDRSNIPDEYNCELCQPRPVDKARARQLQLQKRKEQSLFMANNNVPSSSTVASAGGTGASSMPLAATAPVGGDAVSSTNALPPTPPLSGKGGYHLQQHHQQYNDLMAHQMQSNGALGGLGQAPPPGASPATPKGSKKSKSGGGVGGSRKKSDSVSSATSSGTTSLGAVGSTSGSNVPSSTVAMFGGSMGGVPAPPGGTMVDPTSAAAVALGLTSPVGGMSGAGMITSSAGSSMHCDSSSGGGLLGAPAITTTTPAAVTATAAAQSSSSKKLSKKAEAALNRLNGGKRAGNKELRNANSSAAAAAKLAKKKTKSAELSLEKLTNMVRTWIDSYERASTNHYSPELRARLQAFAKMQSANPLLTDSRLLVVPGASSMAPRCTTVPHAGGKILIGTSDIEPRAPIIEVRGKYMLTSQHKQLQSLFNLAANGKLAQNKNAGPFLFLYQLPSAGTGGMELCVDTRTYGNDARFVRRSCRPNAELQHSVEKGVVHLYIVATANIKSNTEITIRHDEQLIQRMGGVVILTHTTVTNSRAYLEWVV